MQTKSKLIAILLIAFISAKAGATAPTEKETQVRQGLQLLYRGVTPSSKPQSLLENALDFQKRFKELTGDKMPAVTWTRINASTQKFSFDSLVQRKGNHPANTVYGFLYEPLLPRFADVKFPATLIVHHIADDIRPEQMVASMAASVRDSVMMVIYLPHYGSRKGDGPFLTDDPEKFELNIMQSLADIHQAGLILKSSRLAKPGRLQMMGISLGGILALMSAGVDGLFDRYLTFVGGGDLAHILAYPKEKDPDSEVSKALKDIHAGEEEGREMMSRFDPITWAYTLRGKHIVMLNAERDELLQRDLCVDKLVQAYRESGNTVESVFFKGTHRPVFEMAQIWDMAKKSLFPFRRFLGDADTGRQLQTLKEQN